MSAAAARPAALVAFLAGVTLSSPAGARGGVDARVFRPVPSPHAVLSTHGARVLGHLALFGALSLDYANDLLRAEAGGEVVSRPVQHRLTSEIGLAIGLWDRTEIGLSLPIHLRQAGEGYPLPAGSGLGDLRLLPKVGLMHPGDVGLGLAVVAELVLPTGDEESFMGDPGVGFIPRLVIDYHFPCGVALAFNAGYRSRPRSWLDDRRLDDEVLLGAAAEVPLWSQGLSAGLDVHGALGIGGTRDAATGAQRSPVEALGLLRWRSRWGLAVHVAAGTGLTAGYGAPDVRAVVGVGYRIATGDAGPRIARAGPAGAARARKRDRLAEPDPTRSPARLPVAASWSPDLDRAVAADPDGDGDGLPRPVDRCPEAAEDLDRFEDGDGCPDLDNDRDGIPDEADRCPLAAEVVNGVEDDDGCPDSGPARVRIEAGKLAIADRVHFASGSDVLEPASRKTVRQVAAFLRAQWSVRLVRIEGHTDDRGDKELNVDLSERRARRVMVELVDAGVAAHRLQARGYGPTAPVATNGTAEGRLANRRVEFTILKTAGGGEAR